MLIKYVEELSHMQLSLRTKIEAGQKIHLKIGIWNPFRDLELQT